MGASNATNITSGFQFELPGSWTPTTTARLFTFARRSSLAIPTPGRNFSARLAQTDPKAFGQMRGTVLFPFKPGEHRRIAAKVIDFLGNEVVRVVNPEIGGVTYGT